MGSIETGLKIVVKCDELTNMIDSARPDFKVPNCISPRFFVLDKTLDMFEKKLFFWRL